MAYQQFYGNPYSPGVAAGVMEGAKEQTDFARNVQRARLRAERRRLSLAEAQFEWRKDDTALAREMEQKRFAATIQQKQQVLEAQRRREQLQEQQYEQTHKLRRDKYDLDLQQWEKTQQLREQAQQQQAELGKLKAAGEIEDARAQQMQAEIDAKKSQGDQMIRSIQSGAIPVGSDYQLQQGEVDFINPLNEQRFVLRKPSEGDALKYNDYEQQSIRQLNDHIDATAATIEAMRERREELAVQAANFETYGDKGSQAKARTLREQMRTYDREMEDAHTELKSLNLKRAELIESRNPEGAPVDRSYKVTQAGTQEFGSRTPWEIVSAYVRKAEARGQTTTPAAVIQYLERKGFLAPSRSQQ